MDIPQISALIAANTQFKLPDIPHIEERIAEMREIAKTAKVEHACIVDRKTGAVLWTSPAGATTNVDISPAHKLGLTKGNLIMHTHPIPAELSLPDVICVASAQAYGNMAVCADGTVSWATDPRNGGWGGPDMLCVAADIARIKHGITGESDMDIHGTDCGIACDNYWIADMVRQYSRGSFVWATHYGETLMATIKGAQQS